MYVVSTQIRLSTKQKQESKEEEEGGEEEKKGAPPSDGYKIEQKKPGSLNVDPTPAIATFLKEATDYYLNVNELGLLSSHPCL